MKLYVLVRSDLSISQQAIQAGHALAEYLLSFPDTQWKNGTLVYLRVESEEELDRWIWKLKKRRISHSVFIEPDINNQKTALAAVVNGKVFSKLKLL